MEVQLAGGKNNWKLAGVILIVMVDKIGNTYFRKTGNVRRSPFVAE